MLRKMIKRVLFGKRKRNYKNSVRYNYVTWHAHNMLMSRFDNLISHLKLKQIGNHSLIGDEKDAKKFRDQFDY
jgi:hypothetical protein